MLKQSPCYNHVPPTQLKSVNLLWVCGMGECWGHDPGMIRTLPHDCFMYYKIWYDLHGINYFRSAPNKQHNTFIHYVNDSKISQSEFLSAQQGSCRGTLTVQWVHSSGLLNGPMTGNFHKYRWALMSQHSIRIATKTCNFLASPSCLLTWGCFVLLLKWFHMIVNHFKSSQSGPRWNSSSIEPIS